MRECIKNGCNPPDTMIPTFDICIPARHNVAVSSTVDVGHHDEFKIS